MMNKNILVTGGAGYIGSHVVEQLVKKNTNIFILDNLVTGFKGLVNKKAIFIKGDIGNINKIKKIIKKNSEKYNYKYAILRYFNVAGASSTNKIGEVRISHGHLIKNLAIQSLQKKPRIYIYGNNYNTKDGTCVRDYIHVSDLANIHIKSLDYINKKSKSIVLNCGYGKGYSVLDIVNIFKTINKKLIINFTKKRPGDIAQVYADIKKLKKILKWKAKNNNIKKILKSAFKWEKSLVKKDFKN